MKKFALMLWFCCFSTALFATPSPQKIDSVFAKWNHNNTPGAELVIIQNGAIIYKKAYGMANLKNQIPLKTTSVIDIASTSKQVTAFCIALLIEEQKLDLNDDIRLFFPELPVFDKGTIRLKHLVYHMSGLEDYLDFMEDRTGKTEYDWYSFGEVMKEMKSMPKLIFKPGDRFDYCNTNYLLLGEIVKKVTGLTLRQFADQKIFKPLKMNSSFFHDNHHQTIANLALGYSRTGQGYKVDITPLDLVGDGNLYTTVEDFYLWDQNYYKNILGKGTDYLINLTTTSGKLNNGKKTNYGFGIDVDYYDGYRVIAHDGSMVGYGSAFMRFPELRLTIAVFGNDSSMEPFDIVEEIADLYLNE